MSNGLRSRCLMAAFALVSAGCAPGRTLSPEKGAGAGAGHATTSVAALSTSTPAATIESTVSFATPTHSESPGPATIAPTPKLEGLTFADLSMANEKQGWATLWSYPDISNIVRTEDGGWSWTVATPPQSFTDEERQYLHMFPFAFFLDNEHAWVIYDGTDKPVWRTSNGGKSWAASSDRFGSESARFFFKNPSVGWMLLYDGATTGGGVARELYGTEDGGSSWVNLVPYYDNLGCPSSGLYFADEQVGWITGACQEVLAADSLLVSRDGGHTWRAARLPAPSQEPHIFQNGGSHPECLGYGLYSPVLFNRDNGALVLACEHWVGESSETRPNYLYRTLDGGRSWVTSVVPDRNVAYIDQLSMWTVSRVVSGLTISHSSDGGRSWRLVTNIAWKGDVFFVSDHLAYAVVWPLGENPPPGSQRLLRSTDGSLTWEMISPRLVPSMDL